MTRRGLRYRLQVVAGRCDRKKKKGLITINNNSNRNKRLSNIASKLSLVAVTSKSGQTEKIEKCMFLDGINCKSKAG